ncbi:LysR family transcriptional regulator [Photobacterium sp. OFAV2-7]|uniref:LysR family transcriptional regulator n=1 Tax=Photobacterium sp. OFAV2-7 TaxID=2917748 RepID=UPI001EF65F84|nr:LysR family transcriptional regulator [Photobacterium sp. OFAV2-7]MCG7587164.1 LysR family transcriptional regulator [Photobacterium sp. OFAV2-7]
MDKSLQQFLLVARLKSISAAAKVSKLSQPTISSNIKRLEKELGVTLFERRAEGMLLTEYGHILFKHSDAMQHEHHQMMTRITERKQRRAGKIRLGTGDAWWTLFVKQALREHRRCLPSSSIHVEFGNHLSLMDSLINEQIELFIGHEIGGLSSKCNVTFIPLFKTSDAIFVSPHHPLLSQTATEAMLHDYPLIAVTYDSEKYAHLLDSPEPKLNERKKQRLDERTTYELDSLLASIDMVLESNAIMPYPSHLTDYLCSFGLKTLDTEQVYPRGVVGIYLHKRETSKPHLALISHIQELAAKL